MAKRPHTESADWFWPRKEATWLRLRAPDITATAAAALFGVSPYATPFELFHTLAGNLKVEFAENSRMLWGKRLQDAIARGICEDNGWTIVDAHPFLYARSKRFLRMGASPDYIIADAVRPERGLGLLEIKNVDKFVARDDWQDDEAPTHIEFQFQHQAEVCGLEWGAIGGLVGGNETRVYVRERDREAGEAIGKAVEAMFDRVARNDPPAPDYLADFSTIKTLYRHADVGNSVDLRIDPDADLEAKARELATAYKVADSAAKAAKDDKDRATAELLDFLRQRESVFGEGLSIKAPTIHVEAGTVERKASSHRRLYVSFPKATKGKL